MAAKKRMTPNASRALVIRKQWLDAILAGRKTWELRGRDTRVRGWIGLIEAGSGKIVGLCHLDGAQEVTLAELKRTSSKHGVAPRVFGGEKPYTRTFAWSLSASRRLPIPVKYRHPSGAVIWVRLSPSVAKKVNQQLTRSPGATFGQSR